MGCLAGASSVRAPSSGLLVFRAARLGYPIDRSSAGTPRNGLLKRRE
jgi:hypothetical protein